MNRIENNMKIPLYKIYWDERDVEAVVKVIRRGSYWAIGPEIKEWEQMTARYIGTKFAVAFNSGTSALHAMLLAHKISSGDEIIVPSFTFIATANCVLFVNGKPVFADIEDKTHSLDIESVKSKITRKTKAIMPIHYSGCPARDIKALREVANDYNIFLFEDNAESIGASINGKRTGSFGDSSILSYCGNKVITTGEGGMVLTCDAKIHERLQLIRSHGREVAEYFRSGRTLDYTMLGYNWRVPTIIAALGIEQQKKLNRVITLRRVHAIEMQNSLSMVERLTIHRPPVDYLHVYQMFTVKVNEGRNTRDKFKKYLSSKNIGNKIFFEPVHKTRFYRNLGYRDVLPTTERLSGQVITLPIYAGMTKEERDYIIRHAKNFFIMGLADVK